MGLFDKRDKAKQTRQPKGSTTTCLVNLPYETTSKTQALAGLLTTPLGFKEIGDTGTLKFFCLVDGKEKSIRNLKM